MVDYPHQARLKILGRAESFEDDRARAWIERLREPSYKAVVERAFVIQVEAFSWNCPQHITPRFTAEEIQEVLGPLERRLQELELANKKLRDAIQPEK
jgi:predicted pyridoxine 5'-phosphate oxidase superfamily flavin-nucleotide-binding protein